MLSKLNKRLAQRGEVLARPFEGHLDTVVGNEISGWVYDRRNPLRRLLVELSSGEHRILVVADVARQDLLAAGKGDGRHGFVAALQVEGKHTVRAKTVDGEFELKGSPYSTDILSRIRQEPGSKALLSLLHAEAELALATMKWNVR